MAFGDVVRLAACWRYPVKSAQGHRVDDLQVDARGVVGDRRWAVIDESDGRLASAKRYSALLHASVDGDHLVLPDGDRVPLVDDESSRAALSAWLGGRFRLAESTPATSVEYQMTFDPPDDDAELFSIPAPPGTFLDLAPVHLLTTGTLGACAVARPDLDFDVRRFRPNLVVDTGEQELFAEQAWVGRRLRVGGVELAVDSPTVRCAMPLRAQPGLDRQAELFAALNELNGVFPNHLGVYCSVVHPGRVAVGDSVEVLD